MADNENLDVYLAKTIMEADSLGHYNKFDPVFHYTSPDGLLSILQEDGPVLWFSQYDSLNDTTEGIHIIEIYQKVCQELLDSESVDQTFYQAIFEIQPFTKEMFLYDPSFSAEKKPNDAIKESNYCDFEEAQKYVCCFSKDRDSLPMWNYYTKGDKYEGYNIGFSFWRTQQLDWQNCYGKGYNFDLYTVI